MKKLLTKSCITCGAIVNGRLRNTRNAYYYPKRCEECQQESPYINPEIRKIKIKAHYATHSHPCCVPVGTTILASRGKTTYRQIKVAEPNIWMYEHRYIMEQKLGYKLPSKTIVHHKDHNGLNNDLDNLEVMEWGQHTRQHHILKSNQWTKLFACCIVCGETSRKHASRGKCNRCYQLVSNSD